VNGQLTTEGDVLRLPAEARREVHPLRRKERREASARRSVPAGTQDTDGMGREELYAEFEPLVRRLIRQYGDDAELRQDLPGEIFRRFCTVLDAYDPGRGVPLRPYIVCNLSASVYTYVRSHWRRRKREVNLEPEMEAGDSALVEDCTPMWDRAIMNQEVLKALPDAIARLSPRQRLVVVARFYEARSFEDIAATLGVCPATARSLLRHGLNNLRRHFARTGWE
jgi:RNA polymerase sigma factor (sigma-70 family)